MKIGFIGLGIMGKPMSKNLIKAGHELVVCDFNQDNVAQLTALGAASAKNGAEVANQCDLIITMLPNSPHVQSVVLGEGGILSTAKPGTLIVDMSSIAPLAAKDIYQQCKQKGVDMLDAPVSGGEPKAIDATLSIMVGGDRKHFDKVQDILLSMGASAVYCGDIGAGNTTKLANQVVVALNIAAVAEGLMLAKQAEVDPNLVFEAIRGGLAGSTVMDAKAPMMLSGNFTPGFRIDLHIKDLNNAIETAHAVGAPLPLTAAVMEMMQTLRADGYELEDHSALARYYQKLTGVRIQDSVQ